MKTIKITDETHAKLNYLKASLKIDHHINLKTLDDTILYLYECFLEIDSKDECKVILKGKEYYGTK